jgi:hypothetical protein
MATAIANVAYCSGMRVNLPERRATTSAQRVPAALARRAHSRSRDRGCRVTATASSSTNGTDGPSSRRLLYRLSTCSLRAGFWIVQAGSPHPGLGIAKNSSKCHVTCPYCHLLSWSRSADLDTALSSQCQHSGSSAFLPVVCP